MKAEKWIAALLLFFLLLPTRAAAAGEELLANGALDGEGIPEEWSVVSYLSEGCSAAVSDGVAALTSREANDIRLCQTVRVKENTAYVLSAEISPVGVAGGHGACLSIDNYSIDGNYIYSDGLFGSLDWTGVELVFRTGPEQTRVNVALRLGGYSELSTGTARFRSVSLKLAPENAAARSLNGGASSSAAESKAEESSEARKIRLKSYLHLFIVLAIFSAVVMIGGFYRGLDAMAAKSPSEVHKKQYFALAVFFAFLLRLVLSSAWGGHDSDMSCWMGWGGYIANNGTSTFYTAPGHEWYDYPPAYMLVLGLIAKLCQILKIPSGSDAMTFAYMLPAFAADIGIAVLLMRTAEKSGFSRGESLFLGAFVLFDPAVVMLSGAWGQIDSILTLLLLASFLLLLRDRRILAGAVYGLAVMTKWQALIYGPVLAAAYLLSIRSKKDALRTIAAVAAAFAVIFALSLPFKGEQDAFWIVKKFLSASGGYDYASVEAYNFLALCGGNWTPSGKTMFFGISYKTFGTVFILLGVVAALLLQWREALPELRGDEALQSSGGVHFLAASLCMYTVYTFGHYMHERYVFPVILLLLFVYVYTRDRHFLLCSMLLSAVVFLNETSAMYVISRLASSVVRGTGEHKALVAVCSAAETASYGCFIAVCIQSLFKNIAGEGTNHA